MAIESPKFDYSTVHGVPEIALRVDLLSQRLKTLSSGIGQSNVLEIGVGTGDVTLMLARQFKNVTCVDSDVGNWDFVHSRLQEEDLKHVQFIGSTIEKAALPQEGYHHIILQNILEHLKDPVEVLSVLKRHLRTNGHIHISVPLANSLHRWLGVEMGMIPHVEALAESDIQYGHYRVYTPALLGEHVGKAGLKIIFEKYFYLKPLPTARLTPLSMELHHAFYQLGERFPEFASYIYLEATL